MTFDTNIKATRPSVFFVIPEFGQRYLTGRCIKTIYTAIKTLRNEDYHKCRVIISDDGFKKVEKFKHGPYWVGTIPSIELNWPDNVNFAENVNRAIRFIEPKDNDILFIVNSDIEFDKGTIPAMLNDVHETKGIIGPGFLDPVDGIHIQIYDTDIWPTRFNRGGKSEYYSPPIDLDNPDKHSLIDTTALCGGCFALKAELWKYLGGFDSKNFPAFYEDDDLCIRARLAGYSVFSNLDVSVKHARHATMREVQKKSEKDYKSLMDTLMFTSKANFEKKWPEITWDPTGLYAIPGELLVNDFPGWIEDARVRFIDDRIAKNTDEQ